VRLSSAPTTAAAWYAAVTGGQFKLSNDRQFASKLRDIVEPYVDPPAHTVVLSIDERARSRHWTALSQAAYEEGSQRHDDA
jgi:hypothetical protein